MTYVKLSRPQFAVLCHLAEPPVFGLRYVHYGYGGVTLAVVDAQRLWQVVHALQESVGPAQKYAHDLLRKLDPLSGKVRGWENRGLDGCGAMH